jgi:hypothetical protein
MHWRDRDPTGKLSVAMIGVFRSFARFVQRRSRDMSQKAGTTYSNAELLERMQAMHRSWIERLREIRQIESDFGDRLLTAKNPSEAIMVCTEWMARRLETVASEQKTFATAWLDLVSNAVKSARPAPTKSPESSQDAS